MSRNKKPNSLLQVASLSLQVAQEVLHPYSHPKSPHKFMQAQLLSCLVLRAYLKTTYRGVIEVLELSPPLQEALQLKQLPHYSTLKRFADRAATNEQLNALLGQVLQSSNSNSNNSSSSSSSSSSSNNIVAMDSTGLATSAASAYYQSRSGKGHQHYVKLSLGVMCGSLLACALVVGWGPSNDKQQAKAVLHRAQANLERAALQPQALLADGGYDAEWIHQQCWQEWGVASLIPAAVRRQDGQIGGLWRAQMRHLPRLYGKRWHVESFISGLKRTTGSCLQARLEPALFAEAGLRVLTYSLKR